MITRDDKEYNEPASGQAHCTYRRRHNGDLTPSGNNGAGYNLGPAGIATASHRRVQGCAYDVANLGYRYYKADQAKSLDWWARNSATSGNPVILENVSSTSSLDCFHVEGGFGGSRLAFHLANSNLCLNIAGNSHSVGAWVILYPCIYSSNELFYVGNAGTGDGAIQIQSSTSGLCIDLSNGYNRGSILEQKTCKYGDIYQAWFVTG